MCDTLIHLVSILVGYASHVSKHSRPPEESLLKRGLRKISEKRWHMSQVLKNEKSFTKFGWAGKIGREKAID